MNFLHEDDIAKITLFLQKSLDLFLIVLFGSSVKGSMRNDSDVDIAFFSEQDYDSYEVFMVAQELATIIRRDVDLIDLSKVSTVMKAQIVSSGRVIYCSDELRRMNLFMKILKDYAVLNEQRLPVMVKIAERGLNR